MSEPAIERWQPRTITTVPTSHKSLEEVAEAARKKGYAEGLAQGQAEARKQGEETAAELLALWQSMSKPIASQDVQVSEHLLALVVTLTHAVLERELSTDSELIKATLDEALMCLAESEAPLLVTLNPADKALVESLLEERRLPADLLTDSTMLRGGCRLDRGALHPSAAHLRCASANRFRTARTPRDPSWASEQTWRSTPPRQDSSQLYSSHSPRCVATSD